MNIKLIKTYKAEFDHWLNDGSVIWQSNGGKEWREVRDINCFKNSSVQIKDVKHIVINDEYVELRKALAEGKTLQLNDGYKIAPTWGDAYPDKTPLETYPVHCYRIKPEEHQFKIGDWIECVDKTNLCHHQKPIFKITAIDDFGNYFGNEPETEYMNYKYVKLWEPKSGELCWFTNTKEKEIATLRYFNKINGNNFEDSTYTDWYFCEPFLNSKPSWFKH